MAKRSASSKKSFRRFFAAGAVAAAMAVTAPSVAYGAAVTSNLRTTVEPPSTAAKLSDTYTWRPRRRVTYPGFFFVEESAKQQQRKVVPGTSSQAAEGDQVDSSVEVTLENAEHAQKESAADSQEVGRGLERGDGSVGSSSANDAGGFERDEASSEAREQDLSPSEVENDLFKDESNNQPGPTKPTSGTNPGEEATMGENDDAQMNDQMGAIEQAASAGDNGAAMSEVGESGSGAASEMPQAAGRQPGELNSSEDANQATQRDLESLPDSEGGSDALNNGPGREEAFVQNAEELQSHYHEPMGGPHRGYHEPMGGPHRGIAKSGGHQTARRGEKSSLLKPRRMSRGEAFLDSSLSSHSRLGQ